MGDSVSRTTVHKDEKMPIAHPKPARMTKVAQIRRICRYEYGDDLSVDDHRPEPERGEVAWGYFSHDYQAIVLTKQQGLYVHANSGIAGFKVSAPAPQKQQNSGQHCMTGAFQAPYGRKKHHHRHHHQYQPYQPQCQQYQTQYQHPAYAQVIGPRTSGRSFATSAWTKEDWQRITGSSGHNQGSRKQAKE